MRLKDANYKRHLNILVFCDQWKMMWDLNMSHGKKIQFCFISIVWIHFSQKTEKFWFKKSLKYFNIFLIKNIWRQIWICTVKQCLLSFKLRCLSKMLVVIQEIRFSNFTEIVYTFQLRNLLSDQNRNKIEIEIDITIEIISN